MPAAGSRAREHEPPAWAHVLLAVEPAPLATVAGAWDISRVVQHVGVIAVALLSLVAAIACLRLVLGGVATLLTSVRRAPEPPIPPARIETGRAFAVGRRRLHAASVVAGVIQLVVGIALGVPAALIFLYSVLVAA